MRGCLCDPALRKEHRPKAVQTVRDIGMLLGAMYFDFDGKAALTVRGSLCDLALRIAQPSRRIVAAGHLERLLSRAQGAPYAQRPLQHAPRVGKRKRDFSVKVPQLISEVSHVGRRRRVGVRQHGFCTALALEA